MIRESFHENISRIFSTKTFISWCEVSDDWLFDVVRCLGGQLIVHWDTDTHFSALDCPVVAWWGWDTGQACCHYSQSPQPRKAVYGKLGLHSTFLPTQHEWGRRWEILIVYVWECSTCPGYKDRSFAFYDVQKQIVSLSLTSVLTIQGIWLLILFQIPSSVVMLPFLQLYPPPWTVPEHKLDCQLILTWHMNGLTNQEKSPGIIVMKHQRTAYL